MKVGLIARADDRGLGHMTWAFHEHMRPARTLVIDPGPLARSFVQHFDRYPDGLVVPWDQGSLPEQLVRPWLDGLDVLYTAETFYDDRMIDWCEQAGVATVLHAMPEFFHPGTQRPTAVWVPTGWRRDLVPDATVVPVPVEQRMDFHTPGDGPLRVVHVAGNRAAGDRNGTLLAIQALRHVRYPTTLRVETQGQRLPGIHPPPHARLIQRMGGRADRFDLYADADVLLMPRRYGGLCLPVQEAMACGLAVVMPDVDPNQGWPVRLVPCTRRGQLSVPAGAVTLTLTEPVRLALELDRLNCDRQLLADTRTASAAWATAHSWAALRPVYEGHLTVAVGVVA